ncbi:hypothetical protein B0H66DRAFT_94052 [Apodospora peruviana]|uniref:Uncharacterized protein n=1 Tax=Apodospora peruviana TaxID=516989 RepID=A0AAE0IVE7_9PEZI|nr:hypothetical protein B0H66DRAFT_94052 [Apodospora peruviana]
MVPNRKTRRHLPAAMQRLKAFELTCKLEPGSNDVHNLDASLSCLLDSPSLENLLLDLHTESDSPSLFQLGPAIAARMRSNLTSIFFRNMVVDLPNLVRLLNHIPSKLRKFSLDDIILSSGTWEEALEALARKSYEYASLSRPSGAECDDMTKRQYKRVFGRDRYTYTNDVTRYIRWSHRDLPNPLSLLRSAPVADDGDSADDESTDDDAADDGGVDDDGVDDEGVNDDGADGEGVDDAIQTNSLGTDNDNDTNVANDM